ncbi:unnamed protein product [Adineta ricciae]|uniref:Innexin n=1 Tax=Adineta ricciae TaxID=249248 RepID=A0A814DJE2_ADIRI|nr:unnamed protein product [Adineta ricciae]CAF1502002.1 unnamed protein product [Adineta ricciae]
MDYTEIIDNAKRFVGDDKKTTTVHDDLLVDRLHNRYTVAILICFCIAISTYDYLGDPLQCWVPAQFTDNYEDYTNRLCYIQNTYHVSKNEFIPRDMNLRHERTLKYYQWMHFVLLLQALFFSLPRFLWQSFNDKFGLSIGVLVDASSQSEMFDTDKERDAVIQYVSDCLQRYEEYINPLKYNRPSFFERLRRQCRLVCQARTGASLTCFYIFIKLLYIINLFFQLSFLQYFLSYYDVSYFQYGFYVFRQLISGLPLPESRLFPRITLCDFRIRELGEQHLYTVECILVINIFLEKIYIILWVWFTFLLLITAIDLIRFLYRMFVHDSRDSFIRENLELMIKNNANDDRYIANFLKYFPIDNLFILRIMASNSNSLITAEVLHELFRRKFYRDSDV